MVLCVGKVGGWGGGRGGCVCVCFIIAIIGTPAFICGRNDTLLLLPIEMFCFLNVHNLLDIISNNC